LDWAEAVAKLASKIRARLEWKAFESLIFDPFQSFVAGMTSGQYA
jgi:hypothetical protein